MGQELGCRFIRIDHDKSTFIENKEIHKFND